MKKYLFLIVALFIAKTAFTQVLGRVTIANQVVAGSNFQFDIYLKTVPGTTGDIFLGTADYVFTVDAAKFTGPVVTKIGASPGQCNFVPTDPSGANPLFTQDGYFSRTSPAAVVGSEIRINLSDPAPGDQSTFDTRIAKINGTALTHRLGRFQISGFTGTMVAEANLQWKTSGGGVLTAVFTLLNVPPFTSTAVVLTTEISLPLELVDFDVRANERAIDLFWETKSEVNFDGFEVERSMDGGQKFQKIGFQKGKGGVDAANYSLSDGNVRPGVDYFYRLKMIDLDGQTDFSPIRSARLGGGPREPKLYPSPAVGDLNIEFGDERPERLEVFDVLGKMMFSMPVLEKSGIKIDVSGLPDGWYLVRLFSKNGETGAAGLPFLKTK